MRVLQLFILFIVVFLFTGCATATYNQDTVFDTLSYCSKSEITFDRGGSIKKISCVRGDNNDN